MNAALTLIRREYWENRGRFLWLPVVIFALFMLACLVLGIMVGGGFTDIHPSGTADPGGVAQLGVVIGMVFYTLFAFSLISYLVSTLSADRVDKSVLFWRSLPVSDHATVAAKVVAAALLGPAIVWLATIATHLLVLFALACLASARGAAGFSVFASPGALFGTWVLFAYAMFVQALWWLPYFGWLLVISAIFRRQSWMWAILPPVVVGFIEVIFFHTSHFFHFVASHLVVSPVYANGMVFNTGTVSQEFLAGDASRSFVSTAGWISHFWATPSMGIGVGIGLGLLILAVIARRYSTTA